MRYLGGPTVVIELGGARFLTDPTFDPPGDYPIGSRKLTKTMPPAIDAGELPPIDAVLLSHDQHPDNLDHAGRRLLETVPLVLTTPAGAGRVGGRARGLAPWEEADAGGIRVTALPARHGPPGSEPMVGDVTGFLLQGDAVPTVYVSGDNAGLDVVEEIARRVPHVDVAVIFAGGAQTALLGEAHLTLPSAGAVEAARLLGARHAVPIHFEGWAHFSQGRDTLEAAFAGEEWRGRVHIPSAGETIEL